MFNASRRVLGESNEHMEILLLGHEKRLVLPNLARLISKEETR